MLGLYLFTVIFHVLYVMCMLDVCHRELPLCVQCLSEQFASCVLYLLNICFKCFQVASVFR